MFSDNRRKIIIVAGVLLFILLIFLGWRFFNHQPAGQSANANINANQAATAPQNEVAALPPPSPARLAEDKSYPLALKQLAYSFAERLGSYSNVTGDKNLDDLAPLMTSQFRNSYRNIFGGPVSAGYEGYETTALSSQLLNFSASQADVLVKTQRAHYLKNSAKPEIFYQEVELKFVKAGNEWQVDSAQWK